MAKHSWRSRGVNDASQSAENNATEPKRRKEGVSRRIRNTTQAAIHYEALTESGLCWLGGKRWSITLKLGDIAYQIASDEVQTGILEKYATWLNSFDASQTLQISVVNRVLSQSDVRLQSEMPFRFDGLDGYRNEFNNIIDYRLSRGRNNTQTDKYATITVESDDFEEARTKLMRLANESIAYLRGVGGCKAELVSGYGRVQLLHSLLHPAPESAFKFSYDELGDLGMSSKDVVAPWTIDFTDKSMFVLGNETDVYGQTLFLDRLPAWLSDQVVRSLTEINTDLVVSIHAAPLDPGEGLRMVNGRIADMDIQRANEQKKAAKQGYSMDLVPHSLKRAHADASDLREELETSNQKLFSTTVVVMVTAPSKEELLWRVDRVREAGRRHSCGFTVLKWMQEAGLNAALPLGRNELPLFRTMTTATTAVMVPFTTQEIFHPGGITYGVNKLSGNLILGSRQATMNGNAFFLGTSGSGKSMFGKAELAQVLLNRPDDDVIIIDPELDYVPVVDAFGGERIEIHAASSASINPMELHPDPQEEHPIRRKAEFVLSMCEVLIGGVGGLSAAQRSILDRTVTGVYDEFLKTPKRRQVMPSLRTLHAALAAQDEPIARGLATDLELYATGSFSGFANETTATRSARCTLFDISKLGADMRTFGMLVVLEEVWGRIARNRAAGRHTWLYIDEFHVMFANPFAARYFQSIFKRARKYGVMTTGLTQNIDELLASGEARLMLANSDMLALLEQRATDAATLQSLFQFSDQEASFFVNVTPGHGLLRLGSAVVPFDNTLPDTSDLYRLFSSKFGESLATQRTVEHERASAAHKAGWMQ